MTILAVERNDATADGSSSATVQVIDPQGRPRSLHPADLSVDAITTVATGHHLVRVAGPAGSGLGIDVFATPTASQPLLTLNGLVTTSAPAVFDLDVGDDRPVILTAQPESPGEEVVIAVLSTPFIGSSDVTSSSADTPATAKLGGSAVGKYRVLVLTASGRGLITAGLAPIPILTTGNSTVTAPTTFAVTVGPDELRVVTADSADDDLSMNATAPQGGTVDVASLSPSAPGEPVAVLLGADGPGDYLVDVASSVKAAEVTITVVAAQSTALAPGQRVTSSLPATFDVETSEWLRFAVDAGPSRPNIAVRVVGPDGNEVSASPAIAPPLTPIAIPPRVAVLFPQAVLDLFADGLPPTVGEARARLDAAGLLPAVRVVLAAHPDAAALLSEVYDVDRIEPSIAVLGMNGEGHYQVTVTSAEAAVGATISLDAIPVLPATSGAGVTATAPVILEFPTIDGPWVLTATPEPDTLVDVLVPDPGSDQLGPSVPSATPGASATAIVGWHGSDRAVVLASREPSTVAVQVGTG
jgi:hypothetical protein